MRLADESLARKKGRNALFLFIFGLPFLSLRIIHVAVTHYVELQREKFVRVDCRCQHLLELTQDTAEQPQNMNIFCTYYFSIVYYSVA